MLPRQNWFPLKISKYNWEIEWKIPSTRVFHSFGKRDETETVLLFSVRFVDDWQ